MCTAKSQNLSPIMQIVLQTYHISYTGWGLCSGTANSNLQINDFWLGVSKKVNNIISTYIKDTPFSKVTGVWPEK